MIAIRVAQVSTSLFAFAHTAGMLNTAFRDDAERHALETLQAYVFPIMGVSRSHFDFYQGMGFSMSLFLVFCVALMQWIIPILGADAHAARPILWGLSATFLAMAAMCVRWFFPAPLVMSLVTAVALGHVAWRAGFAARPRTEA
jgi:hypothetical protein